MKKSKIPIILILLLVGCSTPDGTDTGDKNANEEGQVANTQYVLPEFEPRYKDEESPVIYVDEGHFNFHTLDGRYRAFGEVLKKDGYSVTPFKERFTPESLDKVEILAIANAFADSSNWTLPTKSAFSDDEVTALNEWVKKGGSLLLVADHMPAAGAASELGFSFGFNFINGYLYDYKTHADVDVFRKSDGSLTGHVLTEGIDSVATFTGQAFMIPSGSESLLNVGDNFIIYLPSEVSKISGSKTPKFYANGLSQGAILEYGEGKLAVFGEAGMFSSQKGSNNFKMGMDNESASQNHLFLLNVIHWLDK